MVLMSTPILYILLFAAYGIFQQKTAFPMETKRVLQVSASLIHSAHEAKNFLLVCTEEKKPNVRGMRTFLVIAFSYLSFTLTDGALRMIVLLTAYQNKFTPFEIAIMFILYEGLSIFTNVWH